jgi:c-di-GMP-binding flagellar brake protein YcgR
MTMPTTNTEKRRERRYSFHSTIDYLLLRGSAAEVHKGVTIDISDTGLGLYLFDNLPEGQTIIIQNALPAGGRAATVCWIKKESEDLYKAGLRFG